MKGVTLMNKDNEDFIELDLLCANLQCEVNELKLENARLTQECSAMRTHIEAMYSGSNM
jgi:FtsZ-binding cell division protein ZapB